MKVFGMLEKAAMELLVGAPSTGNCTGRMYMDVTVPTAGVPYVNNGSGYIQLQTYVAPTIVVTAASTTACTVNWANGLTQQVILSANCTISFSNPVPNAVHTLIVTQVAHTAATATPTWYNYAFAMIDQDCKRGVYQPYLPLVPGESNTYQWLYKTAVRAAYTTIGSNANQKSLFSYLAQACYGGAFSPDGKAFTTGSTNPYTLTFFVNDTSVPTRAPLGQTNLGNPSAPNATTVYSVAYSPDSSQLLTAVGVSPWICVQTNLLWTPQGSTLAIAATNPGSTPTCVGWHPSGNYFAAGSATANYLYVYTNAYTSVKLSDPASLPVSAVTALAFAPTGDYLCISTSTTPFIKMYAFADAGGIGTIGAASSNPATLPPAGCSAGLGQKSLAWHPSGTYVAMAMGTTPFICVYPFNRATGVFGARITPTTVPTGQCTGIQFTPDGQYLVAVGTTSPTYLYVYDFSAGALGGLVTTDGFSPGTAASDVSIHPSGEWGVVTSVASPYVQAFNLPTKVRNYLRLT